MKRIISFLLSLLFSVTKKHYLDTNFEKFLIKFQKENAGNKFKIA